MTKNNDPSFLLYSSDFLTGIADLDFTERGYYITLLCLQHQKGTLTDKLVRLSIGTPFANLSKDLQGKFKVNKDGTIYNSRLQDEINKRSELAEIRRQNGMKGGFKAHSKNDKVKNVQQKTDELRSSDTTQLATNFANSKIVANEDVDVNVISNKNKGKNQNKVVHQNFDKITDADVVINHLNSVTAKHFKKSGANIQFINGRLRDGYTVQQMMEVVELKSSQWLNHDKMNAYLRPQTLFNTTNFESYIQEVQTIKLKIQNGTFTTASAGGANNQSGKPKPNDISNIAQGFGAIDNAFAKE